MPHSNPYDFLFIAPTPFYANRGCHMRIRGEAEALRNKGLSVLIAAYNAGGDVKDLRIKRSFLNLGGWGNGPSASWKKIPATFFLFFTVFYWIIRVKPKTLYCHLLEGVTIGILASFLTRVLTLFTYKPILIFDTQGSRAQEMKEYGMLKEGPLYKFFEGVEKTAIHFSRYVFTSSLQYARSLQNLNNKNRSKVFHLPDAVSLFSWDPDKNPTDLKNNKWTILKYLKTALSQQELEIIKGWIKNKNVIVVYTGSFSPAKGLAGFMKNSFPQLSKSENLRFLFGGGKIEQLEPHSNLPLKNNQIISTAKLDSHNLPYFLLLGDVAIDPKAGHTTEASGKILNYMATGLPIACFGQENNRYFLGEKSLFAKNFKQFSDIILEFAAKPDKRETEGKKNLKRAWEKFTWDLQMEKMLSILNNSNK